MRPPVRRVGRIIARSTPFDAAGQVDGIATLVEFDPRRDVHGLNVLGISIVVTRRELAGTVAGLLSGGGPLRRVV
jgi:hypothetical protein